MSSAQFDALLASQAERPAFQADWDRQRRTARAFLERFDQGLDTQLLADEVGMGKTYVAMAVIAAKVFGAAGSHRRALLVTPASAVLRSKWEQELRSFSQNYLLPGTRPLRPLVVRSYWELAANLHDYENDATSRVSEGKFNCILDSFREWCVQAGYLKRKSIQALEDFDPESEEALRFASSYSRAAWFEFLQAYRARQEGGVRELAAELAGPGVSSGWLRWKLKGLFREFAARQDEFEPNVLILSMSSFRTPRSDEWERQRFSTFILAVLLGGRWESTKKVFLRALKKTNTILEDAKSQTLARLARADLYRTKHCVWDALKKDRALLDRWEQITRESAPDQNTVNKFFKDLVNAVVRTKVGESGIELAVVDEAHNWRDGKNGGAEFRETFAPAIAKKLLLSATPFQLAEGEMRRVFEHAALKGDGTDTVVRDIYDRGIVDSCLIANDAFRKAWDRLAAEPDDLLQLQSAIAGDEPAAALKTLGENASAGSALGDFSLQAIRYREAIDRLTEAQRRIVIRHTKSREHRSFHSGCEFSLTALLPRTALYETPGMSKHSDAFVNFLAMRVDQLARQQAGGSLNHANAHLMSGLVSSKAAFQNGASRVAQSKLASWGRTREYMGMFDACLQLHEHPKVLATVEHAHANYRNGRKTLIFCERVDTLNEIQGLLNVRLSPAGGGTAQDPALAREQLLSNEAFVDLRLMRMLELRAPAAAVATLRALVDAQKGDAIRFAADCLGRSGAEVTFRRVQRLLDIWNLAACGEQARLGPAALKMFRTLRDCAAAAPAGEDKWFRESILQMHGEGRGAADRSVVLGQVTEMAEQLPRLPSLWEGDDDDDFPVALWTLIESEAGALISGTELSKDSEVRVVSGFYETLVGMQTGLRKVLLRPDLFKSYLSGADSELTGKVHAGVRANRGIGESTWARMVRFVEALGQANGTINPSDTAETRRRSLWRGVYLRAGRRGAGAESAQVEDVPDDLAVQTLDGGVEPERRVAMCAAFNSPLAPDILICTAIGSEGIDLHRECSEVIHHDLPWNPARLEQRIGRIDRVGSLSEVTGQKVRVGVPFQEQSYERFQHRVLLSRSQRFEILLGKPEFDVDAADEERLVKDNGTLHEVDGMQDLSLAEPPPCLPEALVKWLSVNLSLA
jgi:superfamily II DNA or RNA helicase